MNEESCDPKNGAPPEGRYSNYFEVGYNAFEFLFEFGQFYSGGKEPRYHTKIVMSPSYAKDLLEILQKSLLQYEDRYGPVVNTGTATLPAREASSPGAAPPTVLVMAPATVRTPVSVPATMHANSAQQFNDAVKAMMDVLNTYLPAAGGGELPAPSVSIASVNEQSLGLNNRRGEEARAGFGVVELKGGRLDAVARFELWATQPASVQQAVQDLIRRLLADRDKLWLVGFLRIGLEATSSSDNVPALNAWRQTADVRVLYEYHFEDADDSQGLIARIPIHIDSTYNESTTVTDEMTRWDDQHAPALVVRGPVAVSGMTGLVFVAGVAPSGTVTLTRTFDGTAGPPTRFTTLAAFLAAVGGDAPLNRNAQLVFASWNNFLAIFNVGGSPVTLGGDDYSPLEVAFDPVIQLAGVGDRFEVAYQKPALDQTAVAYLRAT